MYNEPPTPIPAPSTKRDDQQIKIQDRRQGIIIGGGQRHVLTKGATVGVRQADTNAPIPTIALPNFSIFGDCISPIHGQFIKDEKGWHYQSLGQRGSRVRRDDEWIDVGKDGVLLEDGDQIELGNGAGDADGVFEHLFFELA